MSSKVLVECYNDEALVRQLLGSNTTLTHYFGKPTVSARLREETRPTIALVDEDADSVQPSYLASLREPRIAGAHRLHGYGLKRFVDKKRGHVVVVLSPRLEDWVLAAAAEAGVSVEDFNLISAPAQFKHAAHNQPGDFARLLRRLSSTPRFVLLRGLLSLDQPARQPRGRARN